MKGLRIIDKVFGILEKMGVIAVLGATAYVLIHITPMLMEELTK